MRRHKAVSIALAAIGFLFLGAGVARAADVTINVPTTFATADASDGTVDGVFNVTGDLLITSTGSITCNDPALPTGADACPITIVVTGKMLMEAGSEITADNTIDGGNAGDITITVGTDMTMCGPNGGQPGCASPGPAALGALISAQKKSGGATSAINSVTITVGDKLKATGNFYMEGGVTTYGLETGARIDTTSSTGHAGNITVTAGKSYFTEPGSVVQAGAPLGAPTATAQGGKIFLVSDCALTSQGRVTSKGPDFGADLVHLESCTVLIEGLVESTGKGHVADARNSCDNVPDGLPGEVLRNHPDESTGCVEVWGNLIKIDSTPSWAGELNADIGDGGPEGTSWIDIFALSDLTVIDGTGNDFERDNFGHTYFSTYAVHANAIDGSDTNPSVITALVQSGPLTAKSDGTSGGGRVFEASSTMTNDTGHGTKGLPLDPDPFVGNGSDGGTVHLEASGNLNLLNAWINASGDFFGGSPCPSGSGACGNGGHIFASAWGAVSDLTWTNGEGNVQPNATGDIQLSACDSIIVNGPPDFHGEAPAISLSCAPTTVVPTISAANAGPVFKQDLWSLCGGGSSIKGIKFNDLDSSGTRNGSPLEPLLPGWVITIWNQAQTLQVAPSVTTDANGAYTFPNLAPGTYVICEILQTSWNQTAPLPGAGVVNCTNAGTGPRGYLVTITGASCAGEQVEGKDFGNFKQERPPECPEDPNRAALLTRTVNTSLPAPGFGTGNAGSPINYLTVQAAYDAAKLSLGTKDEVIGLFSKTVENVVLGNYTAKSMTLTQCTSARITAANNALPVWDLQANKKLLIISPDSVGGSIGWNVAGGGLHELKSIRADGATGAGIKVVSSKNNISWNDADGNGIGVDVFGSTNTLKGGSASSNKTYGVHFNTGANTNTLSGATIENNLSHGVFIEGGSGNIIKSNRVNTNKGDGLRNGGTSTNFNGNQTTGNTGKEYYFVTAGVNGGSNKADGTSVPSAAKGCLTFNAGQSCN